MANRWTKREIEWLSNNYDNVNLSKTDFEKKLGRRWGTVEQKAHRLKLKRPKIYPGQEYRDKDWLLDQYVNKNIKIVDIATQCGVFTQIIYYWLDKHDIPIKERVTPNKETLESLYLDKHMSEREIAKHLGITRDITRYWMQQYEIPMRSKSESQKIWIEEKGGHQRLSERANKLWSNPEYAQKQSDIKKKLYKENPHYSIAKSAHNLGISVKDWNGFTTPTREKIRKTTEYKHWRQTVFERDAFTCQDCGQLRGNIHAHHIIHVADVLMDFDISIDFDELIERIRYTDIFNVLNGVTLCAKCHSKQH